MKRSKPTFHFPIDYHPATFNRDIPKSFAKNRPKYLRVLEIINPKNEQFKLIAKNIKHLKYVSNINSSFNKPFRNKSIELLPPCLKTVKHVKIVGIYYSNQAISRANRRFKNLKSYTLQFLFKKTLQTFKTLREVETLKLIYQKMTMGPVLDVVGEICHEEETFKNIRMKKLLLEIPKTSPSEMMRLARMIPKSTQLHLELESLPLTFKIDGFDEELAQKIRSIRLRSLTNSYLKSLIESVDFLKNLNHLRLGKNSSVGVFELNPHTNYDLFSRLKDFKALRSLNLNLKLFEPFCTQSLEFFQKVKLPLGLLTFSLSIAGIPLGATRGIKVQDLQNLFGQIEKMKKLTSLRLAFGFAGTDKNALNEFVSALPRGLQKMKSLFVDIKSGESMVHTDRVFEWARTHSHLEDFEMDIPLINYLEVEKKITFDYNMENLKRLSMSISHESVTMRDFFDDFLVFLSRQKKLKILTLKIKHSHKYRKTIEKLNKYLGNMQMLKYLNLEFKDFEAKDFMNVLGLKLLMSKVKSFSLNIEDDKTQIQYDNLSSFVKKEFENEIQKKGKGFRILFNNGLLV